MTVPVASQSGLDWTSVEDNGLGFQFGMVAECVFPAVVPVCPLPREVDGADALYPLKCSPVQLAPGGQQVEEKKNQPVPGERARKHPSAGACMAPCTPISGVVENAGGILLEGGSLGGDAFAMHGHGRFEYM